MSFPLRVGATYLRPLQEIVGTVALPLTDLLVIVALAAIPAVVVRLGATTHHEHGKVQNGVRQ